MTSLGDIIKIADKIKAAPFASIKIFYKLIFEEEGDKRSRKKIREFQGFDFTKGSKQYEAKLKFVDENFSVNDLTLISLILDLNHNEAKDKLIISICDSLLNVDALRGFNYNNDEEEDEEEDNQEEDKDDLSEIQVNNDEVNLEDDKKDEEDSEEEDEEEDQIESTAIRNKTKRDKKTRRENKNNTFAMTFRDVEDSIRKFDGKNEYPVKKWVTDFEELAEVMEWGELQKLIFAKKLMTGPAKLFILSEKGVTTWTKLKKLLIKEFHIKDSSAEIHKMLMARKKKDSETLQEYILIMREIGSRANLDAESIIQYIIDGIQEEPINKMVLYGARTFTVFKENVRRYEQIKKAANPSTSKTNNNLRNKPKPDFSKLKNNESRKTQDRNERCFNCGLIGHLSRDCRRGLKCFACQQFGHKATDCKGKDVKKNESSPVLCNQQKKTGVYKSVKLGGKTIEVLIDTGSSVNLLKVSEYLMMKLPPLKDKHINLNGFGEGEVESLGTFVTNIEIDGVFYEINIHVVPDKSMPPLMIIGNDFLKSYEVIINRGEVTSMKKIEEPQDKIESFDETLMFVEEYECEELNIENTDYREEIEKLIANYTPSSNPRSTGVKMKIILSDDAPIYQRARRLAPLELKEVDATIQEWINKGIVRPSSSDFSSPIVPVRKKDGSLRVCVDYRKLNKKTIRDRYPLPLIDDQLDKLRDAQIFTTLDLRNGFHHVPVEEESIKYTSFITPRGQYEFLRTPFGLCNAPAVFQRFVNRVFQDLINENIVLTYMDDLIIPAQNCEDALLRLKTVFEKASEYGIEFNWKKCHFMAKEIEYLGYRIANNEVMPSKTKTNAVQKFPKPNNTKAIQSFLGLTGYFRKFISHYAEIARPLSELLKKNNSFKFGLEEENAFNTLKKILSEDPVLKIYSSELYTELHTDASKFGYGAVLMQKDPNDQQMHPVHYMSHKTSEVEMKYHSYELEVLAIIKALQKFRVYLLGIEFTIVTDCAAFQMTMSKENVSVKIWRWASFLQEFRYKIEHRSESRMRHCDALSRYPVMLTIRNEFLERLKLCQDSDENLKTIKELLKENNRCNDYILQNGLLYKLQEDNKLLVIPNSMQSELIRKFHEENGHFGVKKIEDLITREFWIPKLKDKITKTIHNCVSCILAERKSGKQEGWLNSIDKEELPLQTYHIDHLGPLTPTGKGYKYIFVVIDSFTKFVWLYPTKTVTAEEVVTKLECQKIIFGNPKRIISDRGTAFTAKVFEDYCKSENIELVHITTGVPRANGQVERINGIIIPVLTKMSRENEKDWYKHVPKLQIILNRTHQRSINCTPAELLFGVKMRSKEEESLLEAINEEYIKLFQEERQQVRLEAKKQIEKIQEENRRSFNRFRKKPTRYKEGDLVAIRRTQFANAAKLRGHYLGPYRIVKVKRNDRYDVEKVGIGEGPGRTSTAADFMKPWVVQDGFEDETLSEMAELWDPILPRLPPPKN